MITQILYYNHVNSRKNVVQASTQVDIEDRPDQPLLSRRPSEIGLPGSRRRSSVSQKRQRAATLPLIPEDRGHARRWLKNSLSVFAVCALGGVGWFVAFSVGVWKPTIENPESSPHESVPAQILGYLSAVRCLCSSCLVCTFSADQYSYCTSGRALYKHQISIPNANPAQCQNPTNYKKFSRKILRRWP